MTAINLGVECSIDLYKDLSGTVCLIPLKVSKIRLYSDSLCALHWLAASSLHLEKMNNCSTFVLNRIHNIQKLCETVPVQFGFIAGKENPADLVTRSVSYKILQNSCYFSGPDLNNADMHDLTVTIPHSRFQSEAQIAQYSNDPSDGEHLIGISHFSDFRRLILLHRRALLCVAKWKNKAKLPSTIPLDSNFFSLALVQVLSKDQHKYFADVFRYFESGLHAIKDIPDIVNNLNLFIDEQGLIRVKGKVKHRNYFPLLLSNESYLTELIILDVQQRLAHSGCYHVLAELRRHYFIPKHFSMVKKGLKKCVQCRRFNNRPVHLNQNLYRDFRENPPNVSFANVLVDYLGPFNVKVEKNKTKVWILCFTCTWSRAVNLKICRSLNVCDFLRSFSLHCFEYGIPQLCISDLGTQIVAGANLITSFLNDPSTQLYF